MKDKNLVEKINQLLEGNFDTPIVGGGDKTLESLEKLRLMLRDNRAEMVAYEKEIGDTIASVAHDLKTPIAVMLGYAECIEAGMSDKDYPTLIVQKANEMNEQVLSIVEANKNRVGNDFFKPVDTAQFFKEEVDKLIHFAESKNIKLVLKKIPSVQLYCDKQDLAGVLQNLVSNAVKYTPEGGVVKLSFSKTASSFVFSVKDNGQGISSDDLPKIFDKFYMADKARSDTKSSGLGLYTVKKAVERHGGEISVKSKVEKGTKFKVTLPLEKGARVGFDKIPAYFKGLIFLVGFPFNPSFIYRMKKAVKKGDKKYILSTAMCFPILYLIWLYDMATIVFENKIHD